MKPEFHANFERALRKLQSFLQQGIVDELDRAGVIQAFEFTFEQAWKAVQKFAGSEGVSVNSPKQAFTWALGQSWILPEEESVWIEMLADRNLSSHTYREDTALSISNRVEQHYREAFENLLTRMRTDSAVG